MYWVEHVIPQNVLPDYDTLFSGTYAECQAYLEGLALPAEGFYCIISGEVADYE